jgi:hypothetical protein
MHVAGCTVGRQGNDHQRDVDLASCVAWVMQNKDWVVGDLPAPALEPLV